MIHDRLSQQQADALAAISRRRVPLRLRQGSQLVQAVLLPSGAVAADALWLGLRIDGHAAAIALPPTLARQLAGQSLEAASPEDAALLLEDALASWLDVAEQAAGVSLRFEGFRAPPEGIALTLGVETAPPDTVRVLLPLVLSLPAAHRLATALAALESPRAALPGLYLRVAVEADCAVLTLDEIKSLRAGDALVLEDAPAAGALRAVVEDRLVAPVTGDGPGRWRLTGPLIPRRPAAPARAIDPRTLNERTMTEPTDPKPADAKPAPIPEPAPQTRSLDALELRVSFRLGETLMPMPDLRSAGPGTVITLDRPDGALVDIVVNGQVIGQGEIISVSGRKACEIKRIFGEG